jgi:hypothetical protein
MNRGGEAARNDDGTGPEAPGDDVLVPRPSTVKVIIIVESPSPSFLPIVNVSRTFDEESARRMVFAAGEPGRLLVRVQRFLREMGDVQEEEKMEQLYKLFRYGHLVYLSQCPFEGGQENDRENVRREVDALLKEGAQGIVALGDMAKNWVRTHYPPEELMFLFLPLPSNHISSWFPSFLERTARERGTDALKIRDSMAVQIDKLVRLCSEL